MNAMDEFGAALRGEFAKLRASRGVAIALVLFAVVSIGVAALDGWSSKQAIVTHSHLLRSDFTPQQAGMDGIAYGQVALIALGVVAVTCEYGSGMIRLSLLAVPRRGMFIAAKTTVIAVLTFAAAAPVTVLSYLTTQLALGKYGASIGASGVPRALAGGVLYLVLMALFAAGGAVITRSTVAPLAVLIPLVLIGSHLLTVIGATKELAKFFPDQAGGQMMTVHVTAGGLSPEVGGVVLLVWVGAALAAGSVLNKVRDA
jgi:ABC-type transport system involved in multi-copper enzyme maturation permease subunit